MSSLATLEVLKKELVKFKDRKEFLDKWIGLLETNEYETEYERFEALYMAYKLKNERDTKEVLIEQREGQIKQIEQQEELKQKASNEFPDLLEKAKEVHSQMFVDLEALKAHKPLSKDEKQHKLNAINDLKNTIEVVKLMLEGIEERYESDKLHKELLADFRQLGDIVKINE